jgi:hypothetical protein
VGSKETSRKRNGRRGSWIFWEPPSSPRGFFGLNPSAWEWKFLFLFFGRTERPARPMENLKSKVVRSGDGASFAEASEARGHRPYRESSAETLVFGRDAQLAARPMESFRFHVWIFASGHQTRPGRSQLSST